MTIGFNSDPQSPGVVSVGALDIDGAADIGAAIVDADLFIIDDGASGTNRTTAASRIKTYVGGAVPAQANQAALEAETNENTYPPPDLLRHSPGMAKAMCNWEQDGTHSIRSGTDYNYTSVTDGGAVGDTDHLWDTDMNAAGEWVAVCTSQNGFYIQISVHTAATGCTTISRFSANDAVGDASDNDIVVFGTQV